MLVKNNEDKYGFLALQNKILEVMLFIHDICIKNNIEYYLMAGSALGALRHQGFIPWDDDLDIAMTVDNYNKFRETIRSLKGSKYYLQEWGSCDGMISMAKIRDSSTTLIENGISDWNINHGIYVDIFLLHKAGSTLRKIKRQFFWGKYLVLKGQATKKYKARKWYLNVALFFARLTPKRFLLKHALKQLYKYDYLNTPLERVVHFVGRGSMKNDTHDFSTFGKPTLYAFETIKLFGPENIEQYNIDRWGKNYMTPPSLETIKHMQHPSVWDVNVPYTSFKRNKISLKKTEEYLIL